MKAIIRTIPLVLLAMALAGCGSSSTTPLEGPTVAYLYVAGQGANTIFPFRGVSDGEIQALSLSFPSNPIPVSMVLHPNKGLVYVANSTSNTVSGYTLNHQTGTLTPVGTAIAPSPICPAPPCGTATPATSTPVSVGIDSSGQFLFVLNQGVPPPPPPAPTVNATISVFSIDTTRGLLTLVSGSPFVLPSLSAGNAQSMVVSPVANFIYVSNGANGTIAQISFNSSGQLNDMSTVPAGAGANLAGLAIDPKGQFLYASDSANNKILSFSVPSTGALAPVATFALAQTTAETTPVGLAIDSTGSFLYTANRGSDNVTALKISSGILAEISGSPYSTKGTVVSTAAQPSTIVVDVTNAFVYVGNQGSRDVMGFTINSSSGQLTTVTNAPFTQSVGPTALLSTR